MGRKVPAERLGQSLYTDCKTIVLNRFCAAAANRSTVRPLFASGAVFGNGPKVPAERLGQSLGTVRHCRPQTRAILPHPASHLRRARETRQCGACVLRSSLVQSPTRSALETMVFPNTKGDSSS